MSKYLGKRATVIFEKLIEGLTEEHPAKKIDNTNSSFMPVCVELIDTTNEIGNIYSVTHYYKQNGDLVTDPEMTFLAAKNIVIPLTYEQGGLGIYQIAGKFEDGKFLHWPGLMAELSTFANMWFKNIKHQQKL
jgi:hypothetical protein